MSELAGFFLRLASTRTPGYSLIPVGRAIERLPLADFAGRLSGFLAPLFFKSALAWIVVLRRYSSKTTIAQPIEWFAGGIITLKPEN